MFKSTSKLWMWYLPIDDDSPLMVIAKTLPKARYKATLMLLRSDLGTDTIVKLVREVHDNLPYVAEFSVLMAADISEDKMVTVPPSRLPNYLKPKELY